MQGYHRAARGFTLIELLVVIAIIGILASVVVTQLGTARVKARNAAAKSDITSMGKAIETYKTNYNDYLLYACAANTATAGLTGDTLTGATGTGNFLNIFNIAANSGTPTSSYPVTVKQTPGGGTAYTYVYKTTANQNGTCSVNGTLDGNTNAYVIGTNVKTEVSGNTADSGFYYKNGANGTSTTATTIPGA